MRLFFLLCRLGMATVFLVSALSKFSDLEAFAISISRYRLLPWASVHPAAIFLPGVELAISIGFFIGPGWRRAASWISVFLLSVFTSAILISQYRGLNLECGCFPSEAMSSPAGWTKVAINLLWLGAAYVAGLDFPNRSANTIQESLMESCAEERDPL